MEEQKIKLILSSDMVAVANTVEEAINLAKRVCNDVKMDPKFWIEVANMIFSGTETIWKVRNSMPMIPIMQSPQPDPSGEKIKKSDIIKMVVDNRDKDSNDEEPT